MLTLDTSPQKGFVLSVGYIQVRFISFIPIDLFHKLLHTPGSIYTFALKQLRSLIVIDRNEMSQTAETDLLVSLSHE